MAGGHARGAAAPTYLDFERPLAPLDAEIRRLGDAAPRSRDGERLQELIAVRARARGPV